MMNLVFLLIGIVSYLSIGLLFTAILCIVQNWNIPIYLQKWITCDFEKTLVTYIWPFILCEIIIWALVYHLTKPLRFHILVNAIIKLLGK